MPDRVKRISCSYLYLSQFFHEISLFIISVLQIKFQTSGFKLSRWDLTPNPFNSTQQPSQGTQNTAKYTLLWTLQKPTGETGSLIYLSKDLFCLLHHMQETIKHSGTVSVKVDVVIVPNLWSAQVPAWHGQPSMKEHMVPNIPSTFTKHLKEQHN